MLRVQLLHPFARHVGVNLGGGNVAVAEQHLHHPQIRAVVEQVGGKGVAQRVWRQRAFVFPSLDRRAQLLIS